MKKGFTPAPISRNDCCTTEDIGEISARKNRKIERNGTGVSPQSEWGFTLVEILVSVTIIALLVSVTLVSVSKARSKAAFTRATAEIDQIATGALLYYQDKGVWPTDVGSGLNALFYNSTYVPVTGSMVQNYLGPDYWWDWQNWGNDAINGVVFPAPAWPYTTYSAACWQSVDLYRGQAPNAHLVIRKCLRDSCLVQKYCNQNGDCWDTAAHRDSGTVNGATDSSSAGFIEYYKTAGLSAVCENCSDEIECEEKFQPQP